MRVIIFFLLLVIAAFLLLVWRCFHLQYFKGRQYRRICTNQQEGRLPLAARRGVILDCRGRVLAASNRIRTVFAEPRVIEDPQDTSFKLAPILAMGADEICKLITESKNPGFAKIKTGVKASQCMAANKIHRGIGVEFSWRRYYPMGRLAAHIVGFASIDNRGLGGIELQYDKELSGSPGRDIFFTDSHRRPIRLRKQDSVLKDGVGIILTIDASIQQFVRAELLKQYEDYECESAVSIVAEPKSGAILSMVSLPDFDPADIRSADPNIFRNRAVTDQFEPGSVLKPIAAAIALDAGAVGRDEKIFCENGHYRGRGFGRIGEYGKHEFGNLTVRGILVHSSNIGMAKIGQRLGKDRLYKGLKLFGFDKKTGIDLPGEAAGLLRPAGKWTGYSVTRIPFGQEISVTAIQLVRAFCMLANGGRLVRPFLVKAMVDNEGRIIKLGPHFAERSQNGGASDRPVPAVGFVVNPKVAHWVVTDALVGVINEGTGKKARLEKWQVFGKTGTAQMAETDKKGFSSENYVASFIAGAPAEEPAVVVLVSMRKPNIKLGKGYTGGTVAAPAAGRILEKTLNYLERHKR